MSCQDLTGIDSAGRIDIFTMLSLLIHEHGMSVHLLRSSLISFIGIVQSSAYKFCCQIYTQYFIFSVIINGTVFQFWSSNAHSQYKEIWLIFYVYLLSYDLVELTYLFQDFFSSHWGFLCRLSCLFLSCLQIGTVSFLSFQSVFLLFAFLALWHWLGALYCIQGEGEPEISALLQMVEGKPFTFECDVSCRCSGDVLHQVGEVPLHSQFSDHFYHEWILNFVKGFFLYQLI